MLSKLILFVLVVGSLPLGHLRHVCECARGILMIPALFVSVEIL